MDPARTTTDTQLGSRNHPLRNLFIALICLMAKGISAWYSAAGKLNCREDGRRKASKLCDDTGMTNVSPWSLFFFPENKCCGRENSDGGSLRSWTKSITWKKWSWTWWDKEPWLSPRCLHINILEVHFWSQSPNWPYLCTFIHTAVCDR